MTRFILTLLSTLLFTAINAQSGFNTITNLSPLSIVSSTAEIQQSKVWTYAGKHWAVLTNSTSGTVIYRLDGTNWVNTLSLASGTSNKVDVKVAGNLAHIFFWKNTGSYLFSVEYDPSTDKYKFWSQRKNKSDVTLETGVQSATIDIDATGRMWLASNGGSSVNVRWSDPPYSTWSGPTTLATGLTTTDLCEVVAIPSTNKVGVFWSNKNTKRFGFKTHTNGSDPLAWSPDEAPGAESALNIGAGFADHQFNLKATESGTLFSAIKTNYNTANNPQIALMVRSAAGTWSTPYTVTQQEGTHPMLLINESMNKLKVIYSLSGSVSYKESPLNAISFGQPLILINGSYTNSTSAKAPYSSEAVIVASIGTNGASVKGVDGNPPVDNTAPTVVSINRQAPASNPTNASSVTFRATFSEAVTGVDAADFTLSSTGTAIGSISTVTVISTSVYNINISSVAGNGTLLLDLNNAGTGITDIAGNPISGGFTTGETFTIQQIQQGGPTLTTVNIASNNASPSLAKPGDLVTLNFTASEPINPPTVTIATHAVATTAGAGNNFTASYTMTETDATGTIPFTINFSSTGGTAGIPVSSTTNGSSVNFDKTFPTVVSINRQAPANDPTNATSVSFRATFSETVTGVDAADFALVSTGTATGTISSVTFISTTVFDVNISSVAGDGTLRVDLNNGTGIADAAGNGISGGFPGGQTFTISQSSGLPGFSTITPLSPILVAGETKHKPQAKAWYYANQWWCVLSAIGGTKIFRLDGTNWTNVLSLTNRTADPDCWVVGNLVHILGNKKQAFLYTVEYDPVLNNYKLWSQRPTSLDLNLANGTEVSTITVDGTGKLWLAADGISDIKVWWSAPPYTNWSAPITIATGITDDDICTITALPAQGKIGIFWSNQTTKRFGFKTHSDAASPSTWSADELPASQSAIDNVGKGFADDHMSIVVASDGTLYCAAKTGYDKVGFPELIMLVRRPSGTWDNAHTVQMYPGGTQPIVVLNEALNKVKVIYTTATNGGNIVYRESSTSAISFSAPLSLISSSTALYNYSTSTHQTYNPNVVIISTEVSANPLKAISVLASDVPSSPLRSITSARSTISADFKLEAYPNPFVTNATLTFRLKKSGNYTIISYDMQGRKLRTLETSWGDAGEYVRNYKTGDLPKGISILGLKTTDGISTIKIVQY